MNNCARIHWTCLAAALLAAGPGCTTVPNYWPFVATDQTEYRTPTMRIDAIAQFATQSTGVDTEQQRNLTSQLARQIQIEPDHLVRQAIIESIAEFRTPLAQQVLEAGLNDSESAVRLKCCTALGKRGDPASVAALANSLGSDDDIDVQLAAADALGQIDSPDAIQALATALDSNDPALQFAGVESLRAISGEEFGGDVHAWKQFVAGETPTPAPNREISVAERIRRFNPF